MVIIVALIVGLVSGGGAVHAESQPRTGLLGEDKAAQRTLSRSKPRVGATRPPCGLRIVGLASLSLNRRPGVYVCLIGDGGQLIPEMICRASGRLLPRDRTPTSRQALLMVTITQLATARRSIVIWTARTGGGAVRAERSATRSPRPSGRRRPVQTGWADAELRERARRHSRDRHRGADRPRQRPQRPVAGGTAASSAWTSPTPRSSAIGREDMHAALGFMAERRHGRGRHQRRPRAHRRRHDGRGGGEFQGREMVLDEALAERIAEIVAPLITLAEPRRARRSARPTASRRRSPPARRCSSRSGPRPGWWCPGATATRRRRRSSCCRVRRASCSRRGRALQTEALRARSPGDLLRAADAAPVRHPRVGDRRDPARRRTRGGGARAARGHDVPETRRDRDRHAL